MDTTVSNIKFDAKGVCNYCTEFLERSSNTLFQDETEREIKYNNFINQVKNEGKGKKYDCIIGLSGGVDSSFVLSEAVRLGLRPLAVHMDNGWNSELAQHNIQTLVEKLNVDLYTHVINWKEYKVLQQCFFDADVIDVELLYDNAASGVCFRAAKKYNVKYILGGTNQSTEGMKMPPGWNWYKKDKKNIVNIHKKFGNGEKIKSFPFLSTKKHLYYQKVIGIKWISFLDFLDFNKEKALQELKESYNYKPYPYKHYESVFTRFYQGYILPKKFKVDKRIIHLSTLIVSNQLERSKAIEILKDSPYENEHELTKDLNFFLKKMEWSRSDLDEYLARPSKPHLLYGSEVDTRAKLKKLKKLVTSK
jgi:N-acetyl sugar amidotransferase